MTMQMIIAVDESAEFDVMPDDLRAAIIAASVQWPETQMPGTVSSGGKKLVLILAGIGAEDLQAQILSFGLDWQIVAVEDEQINQSLLAPFMAGMPTYDAESDAVEFVPAGDLTGKLQTWAGRSWLY